MNTNDELKQQLWDMAYGLLDPDVEAALRTQIKSDPAVARLYAEVRLQADLVASAARVHDSPLHISTGPTSVTKEERRPRNRPGSKTYSHSSTHQPTSRNNSATNWLAVAGTTALLLLLGYALYQPSLLSPVAMNTGAEQPALQPEAFFTKVQTTAPLTEGLTGNIEIETRDQQDNPRPAELDVRLVDAAGHEVFSRKVNTTAAGHSTVELPGAGLKKGVRLQISPVTAAATSEAESSGSLSTELPLAAEPNRTFMLMEKPFAQPGEQVGFVQLRVGQFSKETQAPAGADLKIEKKLSDGSADSQWTTDPATGVVQGRFKQSERAIDGLAMRRREVAPLKEMAKAQVAEGGGLAKGMADGNTEKQQDLDRGSLLPGGDAGGNLLAGNAAARGAPAPTDPAQQGAGERVRKAGEVERKASRMMAPAPLAAPAGPGGASELERAKTDSPQPQAFGGAAPGLAPPAPAPSMRPGIAPAATPAPEQAPPPPAPAELQIAPAAPAPLQRANRGEPKQSEPELAEPKPAEPKAAATADIELRDARSMVRTKPFSATPADPNKPAEGAIANDRVDGQLGAAMQAKMKSAGTAVGSEDKFAEAKPAIAAVLNDTSNDLQIPEQLAAESLIVVARQGNAVVARQELTARQLAERRAVDLPPEVEGLVSLEFYRQTDATTPILRKEVQRPSARGLQIVVEGLKDGYVPGERVQLKFRVTDEEGRAAPASLGVRVWEETAVQQIQEPLLLADSFARGEFAKGEVSTESMAENHLAFGANLQQNRALEQRQLAAPLAANAGGATGEKAAASIPPADALSHQPFDAQQFAVDSVPATIVLADNRAEVIDGLRHKVVVENVVAGQHSPRFETIGKVLAYSGGAMLVLLGLLFALRRPVRPLVWVPAISVSLLTLVIGLTRFVPSDASPAGVQIAQVEPFAETQMARDEVASPPAVETFELKDAVEGELLKRTAIAPAPEAPLEAATNGAVPAPGTPGGYAGGGLGGSLPPSAPAAMAPPAPLLAPQVLKDDVRRGNQEKMAEARLQNGEQQGGRGQLAQADAADQPSAGIRAFSAPMAKAANAPLAAASPIDGRALAGQPADETSLPSSLFWRPLSATEPDGTVTIEFTMPAVASEYRLLIDAIGAGRLGGEQRLLICREAAPK
ncbi:hypothetical protein NA78x_002501 [Anatilimnocola sp. NA78]|uniref:hypothetical protein n=1 Tax=Anatilimnocola sp. NA78 TaxID=3415683 RepID=UPI003CE5B085